MIGFEAVQAGPQDRVLLVSADIPFIDAAEVDDYAAQAFATARTSAIHRADGGIQQAFARMKRTTLKVREGEFTGGTSS